MASMALYRAGQYGICRLQLPLRRRTVALVSKFPCTIAPKQTIPVRNMGGGGHRRTIYDMDRGVLPLPDFYEQIVANEYAWPFVYGVAFWSAVLMFCNYFIGDAEIAEIPENYVPQSHEYFSHPLSRFIAKYITADPAKDHEKLLEIKYRHQVQRQIMALRRNIRQAMLQDAQNVFYYSSKTVQEFQENTK